MPPASSQFSYIPAPTREIGGDSLLSRGARSQRVVLALYERQPILRSVIDRISEGPAGLRWYLTAPKSKAVAQQLRQAAAMPRRQRREVTAQLEAEGATKRVDVHPFLSWLARPNPVMTGYEFVALGCKYVDLVGEEFVWLPPEQQGNGVVAWQLPPTWLLDIPREAVPKYRLATLGRGVPPEIDPEDMMYRRCFAPADPYERGSGMGQSLVDELMADESAVAFLRETLDTRAREDLLFLHPSFEPSQAQQIEQSWIAKMKSALRRAAPMVSKLPAETTVHKLGRTLRETQLVQIRESLRDAVMQAWGIPPEIMGVLESSNRATISAASYLCEYYLTLPRAEALQRHWQWHLLPRWTDDLLLEFESPVPEDVERMLDAVSKAPWSVKINELRRLLNLAGIGEPGERVAVPAGYVFVRVEDLGSVAPPAPVAPPLPSPPPAPAEEPEPKQAARPRVAQAVDPVLGEAMLKLLAELGASYDGQFRAVVDSALEALLEGLTDGEVEERLLAGTVEEILDWVRYRDALAGKVEGRPGLPAVHAELSRRVTEAVAGELAAVVAEVPYADLYAAASRWAEAHSAELVTAITEETRGALQLLVRTAYDVKASVPQLARALRPAIGLNRPQAEQLDRIARELAAQVAAGEAEAVAAARALEKKAGEMLAYRSQMVAQTELWETGNAVQVETWKKTPGLTDAYESQWDMAPRNPCEICKALHGQRQPIGGTFSVTVGGKRYEFKHPTAHPWCYCSLRLRRK